MAIKFSQFNLRTDHTEGMYLVGYDGNQNIHITVDNLFDDFINGTENTIAMFGTDGTELADSILSQNAGATLLTVAGQLNVDAAATFDTSITVTGDSTLNGNVTLGNASTDLITQTGTLYLNGPVKDTTDTLGAVDQVLLSDATGELTFTDLADLHVGGAEVVEVPVKNVQGSALVKGDPVYISGSVGASGRLEVQLADASNALKMPAVGLLKQDLANNAQGFAVVTGKLRNLTTDPIDGVNPTENDVIYVKPSGTSGAALTTTKPVYGNFIQNIGKVGRVSTSNDGNLVVSSILRTNDIPNLTPGRLWVGSTGNTIESQTLFVDEANGRLGIGTALPTYKLDVEASDNILAEFKSTTNKGAIAVRDNDTIAYISAENSRIGFGTSSALSSQNITMLTGNNYVGIGVTSPAEKLHVDGNIQINDHDGTGNLQIGASDGAGNDAIIGMAARNSSNGISPKVELKTIYDSSGGANGSAFTISTRSGSGLAEKMRIDSSGKVGIGTTSPSFKFDVVGDGIRNIRSTAGWAGWFQNNASSSGVIITAGVDSGDAPLLVRKQDTTEIFSIRGNGTSYFQNGNVGIGTTSPSEKLEVNGNILVNKGTTNRTAYLSDDGLYISRTSNGGYTNQIIADPNNSNNLNIRARQSINLIVNNLTTLKANASGQLQFNEYGAGTFTGTATKNLAVDSSGNIIETEGGVVDGSGTTNYIAKWSDPNTLTDSVIYDNGTNVGIGTTSPARNLHIYDSSGGATLKIESNTANAYDSSKIELIGGNLSTGEIIFGDPIDSDVGKIIYRHDGNSLAFNVGASEKMRMDSSGNVGIGTSSPEEVLHIEKSGADTRIQIISDNTRSSTIFFGDTDDDNAGVIEYDNNSDYMRFYVNASERMRIDSSGRVGIGTTSPAQKLEISGKILLQNNDEIRFKDSGGTERTAIELDPSNNFNIGTSAGGNLRFINGSSYTERMRITSAGNVGIGTDSPAYKLSIQSASSTQLELINSTNGKSWRPNVNGNDFYITETGISNPFVIKAGGNVGIGDTSPSAKLVVVGEIRSDKTANGVSFSSTGGGSSFTAFDVFTATNGGLLRLYDENVQTVNIDGRSAGGNSYFNNGGNVGIGTVSPGQKLHINESTANAPSYLRFSNAQATTGFDIGVNTTNQAIIYNRENSAMTFATNATERLRITNGGNVGIGVTSPTVKLTVNGEIRLNAIGQELQFANHNVGAYRDTNNRLVLAGYGGIDFNAESVGSGMDNQTRRMRINSTGQVQFNEYGSGTFTGTATKNLAVDTNGNIIETDGSIIDGSGTANYVSKWSDPNTLTDSVIYDDGTNVGIGTALPSKKLHVATTGSVDIAKFETTGNAAILIERTASLQPGAAKLTVANNGQLKIASDNLIKFATSGHSGGTERMRINNDGKVGIGTTSPGQKLTVDGDVGITTGNQLFVNDIAAYTGAMTIGPSGASELKFRTLGNERMRIDSSGNIGIGTTSPERDLHIRKSNSGGQVRLEVKNGSNTADSTSVISIYNGGTFGGDPFLHWKINGTQDWSMGIDNSDSDKLKISKNFGPGTNDYLAIDTSGNVGIGTTSPGAKLEVNGEVIFNTNTGTTPFYVTRLGSIGESLKISVLDQDAIFESIQDESADNYGGFQFRLDSGTTEPDFQIRKGSNPALFLVNGGGNVGIGTTSPNAKLEVMGGVGKQLRLSTGTTTYWELGRSTSTGNFEITEDSGDTYFLINKDTGFTGINTTNPQAALSVSNSGANGLDFDHSVGGGSRILSYDRSAAGRTPLIIDNSTLKLFIGGNEKMRLDSSGSVGIGTTSPAEKLDVDGNINIRSTASGIRGIKRSDDGYNLHFAGGSSLTGGSYIEVNGGSRGGVGNAFNGEINFVSGGSYQSSQSAVVGNYNFKTQWNGGSATLMHIDSSSGNVGIGTTSPGQKLSVKPGGNVAAEIGKSLVGDIGLSGYAGFKHQSLSSSTSYALLQSSTGETFLNASSTESIRFRINNSNKMILTNAGNVGIGTTSPGKKLEVNGEIQGTNLYAETYRSSRSDGDTYIQAATATDFVAIGTEVSPNLMRVQGDGNVGIGDTSPSAKLVVVGEIRSDKTANGVSFSSTGGGSSFTAFDVFTATNGGLLRLYDENGQTVNIDGRSAGGNSYFNNGGNVGIGTASPGEKLHVLTTGNTVGKFETSLTSDLAIELTNSQGSMFFGLGGGEEFAVATTSDLNGTDSNLFVIKQNGKVGIGTVNPSEQLHVTGASTTKVQISSTSTSGISGVHFGDPDDVNMGRVQYEHTTDHMGIYTNNAERMRIDSGGNVGIGTTSPNSILEIQSSSPEMTIGGSAVNQFESGRIRFTEQRNASAGFQGGYIHYDGSANKLHIGMHETSDTTVSNDVDAITILRANRNVGIGTTSPSAKLEIEGDGSIIKTTRGTFAITTTMTSGSHSILSNGKGFNIGTSDANNLSLKTNNNSRLLIDSAGAVGIGTTSPICKLHVVNGSSGQSYPSNVSGVLIDVNGSSNGYYGLRIGSNTGNNHLCVTNAGNVGIGTASPASKLDVNGGIRMANDSSAASSSNVGTLRYRTSGNNSYVDMCMQTGASTYAWVNIVQNNW